MSTERDVAVNQLKLEMLEAFTTVVDNFCNRLKTEEGQKEQNGKTLVGMFDTLVVVKAEGAPAAVLVNAHVTDQENMDPEARMALALALAVNSTQEPDKATPAPQHVH